MREIKFRSWYDNKMWYLAKLDLWGDPDQTTCDLAPHLPNYEELYDIYLSDVILMQCTGLKDVNGIEIYEGDIIKVEDSDDELYFVKFKNGSFYIDDYFAPVFINQFDFYNVVGNSYDNPELVQR